MFLNLYKSVVRPAILISVNTHRALDMYKVNVLFDI